MYFKLKVWDRETHCHNQLFVGKDRFHLALAGTFALRTEEEMEYLKTMFSGAQERVTGDVAVHVEMQEGETGDSSPVQHAFYDWRTDTLRWHAGRLEYCEELDHIEVRA